MFFRRLFLIPLTILFFPGLALADPYQGFYLGGQAGYIRDKHDLAPGGEAEGGLGYGGYGGLNLRILERFVIGVEGDVLFTGNDVSIDGIPGVNGKINSERTIGASARGGILLRDTLLAYAKLGYVNGKFSSAKLDGVRFGGGLEAALSERTSLRLEYLYSNFEGFNTSRLGNILNVEPQRHQILLGLGFHF